MTVASVWARRPLPVPAIGSDHPDMAQADSVPEACHSVILDLASAVSGASGPNSRSRIGSSAAY